MKRELTLGFVEEEQTNEIFINLHVVMESRKVAMCGVMKLYQTAKALIQV